MVDQEKRVAQMANCDTMATEVNNEKTNIQTTKH